MCEADATAARGAHERVTASLEKAAQRGKLTPDEARTALDRLTFTENLDDLADRQLVIAAIVENLDAKSEVLAALDKIVRDLEAVLATHASAVPVTRLGRANSGTTTWKGDTIAPRWGS